MTGLVVMQWPPGGSERHIPYQLATLMLSVPASQDQVPRSPCEKPPKEPQERTAQAMKLYCLEYAQWILKSNRSGESLYTRETAQVSPQKAELQVVEKPRKRRSRDADEGTAYWIQDAIDLALEGITNYSEAISRFRTGSHDQANDINPDSHLCILKYAVPPCICAEYEGDAHIMVLFTAGLHKNIANALHKSGTCNSFSLQTLQDKLSGRKRRKTPVLIIGTFLRFYETESWVRLLVEEGQDPARSQKMHSQSLYERINEVPLELTPALLAKLASSL